MEPPQPLATPLDLSDLQNLSSMSANGLRIADGSAAGRARIQARMRVIHLVSGWTAWTIAETKQQVSDLQQSW